MHEAIGCGIVVALLGVSGCSKSGDADAEAAKAEAANVPSAANAANEPNAARQANSDTPGASADASAERADWSAFFASGPCLLSAEEMASAVGAESLKMAAMGASCRYEDDTGQVMIAAHKLGEAEVTHQLESVRKREGMSSLSPIDVGSPRVPSSWEGGARSKLNMFTKEHMVVVSIFYPRFNPFDKKIAKEQKDEWMAERTRHAEAVGRKLVAAAQD